MDKDNGNDIDFQKVLEEEFPLPTRFILDVNHDCNLKCFMCVKRTMKEPFGQKPLKYFIDLVRKLPWSREISIGALGDPMCYREYEKALRFLQNSKIQTSNTSNATLLNKDNIQAFPYRSMVHFSVDSGEPDIYSSIRGSDIQKTKDNIRMIRSLRPDLGMCINHLLMSDNILTFRSIVDFSVEIGIPITFFLPMYFNREVEQEHSVHQFGEYTNRRLEEIISYCNSVGAHFSITYPVKRERLCTRAFEQPIIAYDGTVYPCDYIYQNIEDSEHPKWISWYKGEGFDVPQELYMMGNINDQSFIGIWNSERYRKLRRTVFNLNSHPINTSFESAIEGVSPFNEFDHCKICLARWSICL